MPDASRLTDHWWPRPGWRPGRIMLTWHITFEHATNLHALVGTYQRALAPLPGLHPIPTQWLHLTVQGLDYTDAVTDDQVRASVDAVTAALAAVRPFELTFGRPTVQREGISIYPTPADPVRAVWTTIREGIGTALGRDAVQTGREQASGFHPHVSVAYSNAEHDGAPYAAALDAVDTHPVVVPITGVRLIRQERVLEPEWVYRWTTAATVSLGR